MNKSSIIGTIIGLAFIPTVVLFIHLAKLYGFYFQAVFCVLLFGFIGGFIGYLFGRNFENDK